VTQQVTVSTAYR